jgi:hypothetical protein
MVGFEAEYHRWLEAHLACRTGERRRRLKEGHGHGEKLLLEQLWWPVLGNFDFLHPEYEYVDEDGSYFYMDLAYVRLPRPTSLEADGFGPHARDADRVDFTKEKRRQNSIALSGWNILRFSTDDIREDPAHGRRTLVRMLQRWYGQEAEDVSDLPLYLREIVRLATRSPYPITPSEVSLLLGLSDRSARELLHQLVNKRFLEPASGQNRIRSYRLRRKK